MKNKQTWIKNKHKQTWITNRGESEKTPQNFESKLNRLFPTDGEKNLLILKYILCASLDDNLVIGTLSPDPGFAPSSHVMRKKETWTKTKKKNINKKKQT